MTRTLGHGLRATVLALAILGFGLPAFAQSAPSKDSNDGPRLFPRYDFHLTAEHISHDDPRYVWDMNYGAEVDIFGYRSTRVTFIANYEAMLGEELRNFDPNQGNYVVAGSVTTVIGGVEVGPAFYHQSRHLSDRIKPFPVDWNMLGGHVAKHVETGAGDLDAHLDLRHTLVRTYVDYEWELNTGASGRYRLYPHVAVIGGGFLRRLGVDGSRGRGAQTGGRLDGGLRFDGVKGAVEFFLAVERRIDPYQLEFGTERWTSVGMRFVSR